MDDRPSAIVRIEDIAAKLAKAARAEAVILFGSRANGTEGDGSDWDLCVVIPQDADPARDTAFRLRERVGRMGLPVDIVVARRSDLIAERDEVGSLAYPIAREGRILVGGIDDFFVK